jgi:HK97 gp10 family phage protein
MSAEIRGLDNVLRAMDNLVDPDTMIPKVQKACALVERTAKQKAPKDTGALRRSITSKVEHDGTDVVGIVYTPLEYAPYVEYGTGLFAEGGDGRKDVPWRYQADDGSFYITSGQHPQPYMRPALDENRAQILRILQED